MDAVQIVDGRDAGPLRGDVDSLPHWRVPAAGSQQELARVLEEFRRPDGPRPDETGAEALATSDDADTPSYVVHVQGSAANPGSGGGDDDSGCSTSDGGHGHAWLLALLALLGLARPLMRRKA